MSEKVRGGGRGFSHIRTNVFLRLPEQYIRPADKHVKHTERAVKRRENKQTELKSSKKSAFCGILLIAKETNKVLQPRYEQSVLPEFLKLL